MLYGCNSRFETRGGRIGIRVLSIAPIHCGKPHLSWNPPTSSPCDSLIYFGIMYFTRFKQVRLTIIHTDAVGTPNRCSISGYELLVANLHMHNATHFSPATHLPSLVSFMDMYSLNSFT